MQKINSYDVFDTLLARRFVNNDPILASMEGIVEIKGFAAARKAADTGSRSLLEIYQALVSDGVVPPDALHAIYRLEIELEKRHVVGIPKNINQVNDGDLLISDMYLSAADILELVRAAGCNKQLTIYQSNADKRIGTIWDVAKNLNINRHMGDNVISDINNAKARGVNTEEFPDAAVFTNIENALIQQNLPTLACLIREVRLKTLHEADVVRDVAGQVNLPWLLLACEQLARKHPGKNLVFLGRDCQLLYKVFNAFYGNAYYVPFSRKVALNQPDESVGYLKNHMPPNAILVDISSTGYTWEKICAIYPFEVEVLIYSDKFFYSKNKPTLPATFSWITQNSKFGNTNEVVELFNCGDHGYLSKLTQYDKFFLAEFAEHELSNSDVARIHSPINIAISTASNYNNQIARELSAMSKQALDDLYHNLLLTLCAQENAYADYKKFIAKQNEYTNEVKNAKTS
jgi:hypothetical protein